MMDMERQMEEDKHAAKMSMSRGRKTSIHNTALVSDYGGTGVDVREAIRLKVKKEEGNRRNSVERMRRESMAKMRKNSMVSVAGGGEDAQSKERRSIGITVDSAAEQALKEMREGL